MKLSQQDIEELVALHYEKLYHFALSLTRNEAESADLTQQTFLTLATKGNQLRDKGKAKSWLFTVIYREFLKLRKFTNRFTELESDLPAEAAHAIDDTACRQVDAHLIMESLQSVPEIFRAPVALFYLEDLSYKEIASILDIPIGTVMSRLSRGKEELRSRLSTHIKKETAPENVIPLSKALGE